MTNDNDYDDDDDDNHDDDYDDDDGGDFEINRMICIDYCDYTL